MIAADDIASKFTQEESVLSVDQAAAREWARVRGKTGGLMDRMEGDTAGAGSHSGE